MAGAGFKTFNTGDVLLASEVNTYLMQQTVMVFDDATARTSALGANVAEGMFSYLKDTNLTYRYDGSAWLSDAGTTSPLTTKGDLWSYTTTDARLAVGNNGETLVADSSATTGLRWQGNFVAGKNKIINGDFYINQRAFSSTTTAGAYGFDRWYLSDNTTVTYSAQNFTTGTAPVSGYEGKSFARCDVTTSSAAGEYAILIQPIEDVRTLAGQTVTVSLWAKASSGTPKLGMELYQSFGSGGSAGVSSNGQSVTISTSWTRYSATFSVPSISGKTIGTGSSLDLNLWFSAGSNLAARSGTVGNQTAIIDVWGVQVEAGSVATPFQTATGTLAGELAAAMRYYYRTDNSVNYNHIGWGLASSATNLQGQIRFPVRMRVAPSAVEFASLAVNSPGSFVNAISALTMTTGSTSRDFAEINATSTGMTQNNAYTIITNNTTNGYLAFSAEL